MKNYVAFALLLELHKHEEPVSATELASKFEMTPRSIYRYLEELESAGIPTFSYPGRGGGIGIEKNFAIEGLFLSDYDKTLLIRAINSLPADTRTYLKKKLSLI